MQTHVFKLLEYLSSQVECMYLNHHDHSSLVSPLLHSRVNLEWRDKVMLANLLLPGKSGTA